MFFKKAEKKETPALLQKKNILLNCKEEEKNTVIRKVGGLLVESGYVNESYVDAMIKREDTFATYMGNGIALPHGIESAKSDIISSGIAVMLFPEGTDWEGDRAKVVIGISGKGDDHLSILSNIAIKLGEEDAVDALFSMDTDEIYTFLTKMEA